MGTANEPANIGQKGQSWDANVSAALAHAFVSPYATVTGRLQSIERIVGSLYQRVPPTDLIRININGRGEGYSSISGGQLEEMVAKRVLVTSVLAALLIAVGAMAVLDPTWPQRACEVPISPTNLRLSDDVVSHNLVGKDPSSDKEH